MSKQKLTDKQEMFCKEYMIDLNATQAAIRAGYSEHTAKDIGCENLAKPNIQEYIQELKAARSKKLEITSLSVLQELHRWAYGDFTDIMELSFSDIKELPIAIRRLITGFERIVSTHEDSSSEKIKINFVSKERAIELITKHLPDFYAAEKSQVSINMEQPLFGPLYDEEKKK